jgi:hypothetical protein
VGVGFVLVVGYKLIVNAGFHLGYLLLWLWVFVAGIAYFFLHTSVDRGDVPGIKLFAGTWILTTVLGGAAWAGITYVEVGQVIGPVVIIALEVGSFLAVGCYALWYGFVYSAGEKWPPATQNPDDPE